VRPPSGATPDAAPEASPDVSILPFPSYPLQPQQRVGAVDYVAQLDPEALAGARIGVARELTVNSHHGMAVFEEALQVLASAGAELVDPVEIPSLADDAWGADTLPVLEWELKAGLADYFADFLPEGSPITSLADVIAFNEEHAEEEMPFFDQAIFLSAEQRTGLDDPAYIQAVLNIQMAGRANGIDAVLQEHGLDALVAPTNGPATRIDLVNGDHWLGGTSTLAAIAGYPLVTVPAGYRHGLPVGITFMGTAFSEATLIRLAYAFEQAAQVWQPPTFVAPGILPPEV
jgi:amidase